MLADYVMKNIDNLFSQKLTKASSNSMQGYSNFAKNQNKHKIFNKQTIKQSLHKVIRKRDQNQISPNITRPHQVSPSPISKSRLKNILQNNKQERIRSVVKNKDQSRQQVSPYRQIDNDSKNQTRNKKHNQQSVSQWNQQNKLRKCLQNQKYSCLKSFNQGQNIQEEASSFQIASRKSIIFSKCPSKSILRA